MVGIGYSIYGAAIWASIPYVVKPQTLGTAFGVTTAVQNGGLALFPTIGGAINKATADKEGSLHGYRGVRIIF